MNKILIEKEELIRRRDQLINIRFPTISCLLFFILLFKLFLDVPFSNLLFFLVSLMLITTLIYAFILDRIKSPSIPLIIKSYFAYMLLDLINLTIIIYFLGGVLWIGFIFYAFYIYINFLILPRKYAFFLIGYCAFLCSLVAVSQYYLDVYPYEHIFSLEERNPQNLSYLVTTGVAAIAFLFLIGYYGDVFYKLLREKIEELQKTKGLLEEERASLKIRVGAKTEELWIERESLQEKVKERTKELEAERKELAKRIAELEKFHKLAVGRELKMRELKSEIEKMKGELKKNSPSA